MKIVSVVPSLARSTVLLVPCAVTPAALQSTEQSQPRTFETWSREVCFQPSHFHVPATEGELAAVVRQAVSQGQHVKVFGSGHSFNDIFKTDQHLVSLEKLNGMRVIDADKGLVQVGGGAKLKDVTKYLAENGLAMSNLGAILEQSIAGALTTGTHGSGLKHGILATQVTALKLLTADGKTRWVSRETDPVLFRAASVGLGGLGIVTELVLKTEKAFKLKEENRRASFEQVFGPNLERLARSTDHVQLAWLPHTKDALITLRTRTDEPITDENLNAPQLEEKPLRKGLGEVFLGLTRAHWLRPLLLYLGQGVAYKETTRVGQSAAILTVPVPPRYREIEVAVPLSEAAATMRDIRDTIEKKRLRMNLPIGMRFVKGDDLTLSPSNGGDRAYITVLLSGSEEKDDEILRTLQQVCMKHGGRPHWGKEHAMTAADAKALYGAGYDEYVALRAKLDPRGTFSNAFLDRLFKR